MPRVLNKNGLMAVLDVGTSKTCCILARPLEDEKVDLVSIGFHQSRGIDKAGIADLPAAVSSVMHAVAAAEKETGERIETVVATACAKQFSSFLVNESVDLDGKEATQADVNRLIAKAQNKIPEKNDEILHCIPIDYGVDDRHGLSNPIGLTGDKLSLILHTVMTPLYPMRDMDSMLEQSHLNCAKKVASPYAAGLACLTREEAEQGSVVIDLGAGSTGIGYFYGKQFTFCDRIPLGANVISKNLAQSFKMAWDDAERIKTLNGSTIPSSSYDQEEIEIPLIGEKERTNLVHVSKSAVTAVIEPVVDDIFHAVRSKLEEQGFYDYCLNAVLVGGGAQMHGICEKARAVLGLNARLGKPLHIPLRQNVVPEHMFPMAMGCFGLLRYTSRYLLNSSFAKDDIGKPKNKFVRFFHWFLDNC